MPVIFYCTPMSISNQSRYPGTHCRFIIFHLDLSCGNNLNLIYQLLQQRFVLAAIIIRNNLNMELVVREIEAGFYRYQGG